MKELEGPKFDVFRRSLPDLQLASSCDCDELVVGTEAQHLDVVVKVDA